MPAAQQPDPAQALAESLAEPRTAAAISPLLDHADLLALLVSGLDALVSRGDMITDSLSAHPDWMTQIIVALATAAPVTSRSTSCTRRRRPSRPSPRPGAPRVQFFECKQATTSFGDGTRAGCLFYEFGCRGPMTHSPCNRILWNRQSSKTRAGMPCTGCTEPEYPFFDLAPGTVFKTQMVSDVIPQEVRASRPSNRPQARGGDHR